MFELRPYQQQAVDFGCEYLDEQSKRRPILCAPTGSGKTVIAGFIAQHVLDTGRTCAFLTPREEILWQNHTTVGDIVGQTNVAVLKAGEEWRSWLPMHIVSWPTLVSRSARSDGWYPDVDVLLIDECHLAVSPAMLQRVLAYYEKRETKIIGLTATPSRRNGKGLGYFFSDIKHVTTVQRLVDEGYLAPCEYWGGKVVDLQGVRDTHGDFSAKQLSDRGVKLVGDVLNNWVRLAQDRHTLVFAADVAHCEALTERFIQAGVRAASLHIHKTPERRREIVDAFKSRRIDVLVNVSIASYGFDAPSVDCIVLARPTKSIVLHLQMLGRGMRSDPENPDKFCMVIDHADNVRRIGRAEDPFRWRLDGKKKASGNWARDKRNPKREKEAKPHTCEDCEYIFVRSLVCPKCGWEVPLPKRDIKAKEADLVRLSKQRAKNRPKQFPDDETFHRMLMGYAIRKGYKPGWVVHTFKDYAGKFPPWGWDRNKPLEPSVVVKNWIVTRLRRYARKQKTA